MITGPIVSNSSPFIALEKVGKLDLLPRIYKKILIPSAVRYEVFGPGDIPAWIEEKKLTQPIAARMTTTFLGPGEREAIALALELSATELILDDLPARRLAGSLGLPVIGTLGLLLRAKKAGFIDKILPIMDDLQNQDFRISQRLRAAVLLASGEG